MPKVFNTHQVGLNGINLSEIRKPSRPQAQKQRQDYQAVGDEPGHADLGRRVLNCAPDRVSEWNPNIAHGSRRHSSDPARKGPNGSKRALLWGGAPDFLDRHNGREAGESGHQLRAEAKQILDPENQAQ